jgi:hypothetical protein
MAYTYDELHKKTVAELREIAEGLKHESLEGHTAMHKHQLLPALCKVLGIELRAHHAVVGINKTAIKAQIHQLKQRRDAALEQKNSAQLQELRHKIKRLKRRIRRATV